MKIGLALGSGSARGWAHIGVIEVLAEHGIHPDVVAGTSIGSIVGASYTCGNIERMKEAVLSINKLKWATFFSPSTSVDGWLNHKRLREFFLESGIEGDARIEDMHIPFGCVACDLVSGHEKWFTKGSLLDAVWASMSVPGLFPATNIGGRWYIDGGIVNPVPVTLCRALGADVVIAVNLNNDILTGTHQDLEKMEAKVEGRLLGKVREEARRILPERLLEKFNHNTPEPPSARENVSRSINIAQDIITRSRLAGDPPDVLLTPRLAHFGLLDTFRGAEGIEEGRHTCERMLPVIEDLLGKA